MFYFQASTIGNAVQPVQSEIGGLRYYKKLRDIPLQDILVVNPRSWYETNEHVPTSIRSILSLSNQNCASINFKKTGTFHVIRSAFYQKICQRLIGTWTLVEHKATHINTGHVIHLMSSNTPVVFLYSAEGFMSAHLMRPGAPAFSGKARDRGT